ncbi:snRNA-activating protein complex subunit 2 [Epinephelus moara]|uniref:snRNA-activating protein complex subunit 2 n=1 Tax=Epinephelus moara TaxID=300413 RepID=UPI00214E6EB5|nr:snRNA-activating protein complex subunit 2 [Epinephelus moara]
MKPPPRKRTKPTRNLSYEPLPPSRGKSSQWQQVEQKNLLKALKRLGKTTSAQGDIDYDFLKKHVPTRSISEIQSVVEYLKGEVISLASIKLLKKRWEEKKDRKPIEEWTYMASAMAGTLEEPISTAFSQMLIVSSTEPRTLRNCDPPQVYRPPTDEDRPVGRTITFRPMPRLPVKAEHPGTNTAPPGTVLKTPAPAIGPVRSKLVIRVPSGKMPPPQQKPSTTAGAISTSQSAALSTSQSATTSTSQPAALSTSQSATTSTSQSAATSTTFTSQSAATSCQRGAAEMLIAPSTSSQTSGSAAVQKTDSIGSSLNQTTQQPSEQHLTTLSTTSASNSTSSGPHTLPTSSATFQTPVPSTAASSGAPSTHPTPTLSTSAAAFHAKFGRTSKYATEDSPRMFGVKSVVDFERIYRYLSAIHKPNEDCHLTPMESAIVLDLLMSLPEELSLLDCNKLHKHLIKVYRFASSTADSKMADKMLKDLKNELCAHTDAPSSQSSNGTNVGQNSAATADSGGKKQQPDEAENQSAGSSNALSHPPLNPFMVPLKLLMRK